MPMKLSRRTLVAAPMAAAVALAAFTSAAVAEAAVAEYPEKPVRIVVPTQAGGGMDSVARILQAYNDETNFLGNKIVVINKPGAGGTIATREIMESEADGYTIGFWHEGLITSKVMGVVDFDHSDFEVLGATGYGTLGLGVSADSDIKSFEDVRHALLRHLEKYDLKRESDSNLPEPKIVIEQTPQFRDWVLT